MTNMKKLLILSLLSLTLAGCGFASPDAGQEGVLTQKPWFFGHGGVDPDPVRAGRTFIAFTTDVTYVWMVPLTYKEHFDDIMTSDGLPISFDMYGKFQVIDSVSLVRDFGGGAEDVDDGHDNKVPYWYYANLIGPLRNIARDAIRHHDLRSVAIDQTAQHAIEDKIKTDVAAYLVSMRLPVRMVDISLGKANPPEGIKRQRVLTSEAEQRQLTELQVKLAEDARKAAEESRAAADSAYQQRMGLSTEQFVALQAIQMQREVCGNGKCTFIATGTPTSILVK